MIFYPINTLVTAGIDEVLIVVGGLHSGHFMSVLRNGKDLGVKHLEFAYQEEEGGIAQALALAESFSDGENIAVILGDNTTDANISQQVDEFREGAAVFLKEVSDPERFGVPTLDLDDKEKVIEIIEKPKQPKSNLAVTGLYLFDKEVFKFIKQITPSERGELEITDVNNFYIKKGRLRAYFLDGYWRDAGTFDTLLEANNYWAKK